MDNEQRLKQIAFLLAHQSLSGPLSEGSQTEKIVFLSKAGFVTQEIAELTGATAATVSVRVSESKKTLGKKKTKK